MLPRQEMTFDVAVCDELRRALTAVMQDHPEVKCLGTSICWQGDLNDANINHAVWIGRDGEPVLKPDGVIGSVHQTLRLLDHQLGRGLEIAHRLRQDILQLATDLVTARTAVDAPQTPQAGETHGHSKGESPTGG